MDELLKPKKAICNGCGDKMKKGDEFVRIGEIVICDYCIGHNWHKQD